MRILITGIGDAFSRLHYGSSAMIEGPEGWVLLDCPDAVNKAVHEGAARAGWSVEAADVDDIIITHLHGDHCNGVESLGFARMFRRRQDPNVPRLRIHMAAATAARFWERLAPAMDAPSLAERPSQAEDFFDVRTLQPGRASTVAGLEVRCRMTKHPVPTIGVLISDGRGTLGWSGDTAFDPAHIEWLSEADLIVHEANAGRVHTPVESLDALPAELKSRLRIIHLQDDFDPSTTDLEPLREGEVIEL